MLKSILLHLNGARDRASVIECGVGIAHAAQARVCGVSLLDTRRAENLRMTCESAAHLVFEQEKQKRVEKDLSAHRKDLAMACLAAGLNFDVRRASGDPIEVLPDLAKFHDLFITSYAGHGNPGGLSGREIIDLALRGVQPLLTLREKQRPIQRVLMAFDGSEASSRAIRSYLAQNLFPDATYRLLGIGKDDLSARELTREMADYCQSHLADFESGYIAGGMRCVLVPYLHKWEADLVVLGVTRVHPLASLCFGQISLRVLRNTSCVLYASG